MLPTFICDSTIRCIILEGRIPHTDFANPIEEEEINMER